MFLVLCSSSKTFPLVHDKGCSKKYVRMLDQLQICKGHGPLLQSLYPHYKDFNSSSETGIEVKAYRTQNVRKKNQPFIHMGT
jgi:hypothetical protein